MTTSKERRCEGIASLYSLKAVCALLVVAIHAPAGVWREDVNSIASFAVPLFLTITGYFLYSSDHRISIRRITTTIRRLIPTLLFTQALYSFLPHSGFPLDRSFGFYLKWALTGVNHNNMHLWYLHSLLWGLAILLLFLRSRYRRFIPLLILFVPLHYWLAGFVFTESSSLYWTNTLCFFWRYTLATAVPYLALGYYIKCYEKQPLSLWYRVGAITVYFWCLSQSNTAIALLATFLKPLVFVLSVYSIFAFCLSHQELGKKTLLSFVGEKLSSNIYYWHILVLYALSLYLPPSLYQNWGIFYTFVFSSLLAYIIYRIQTGVGITLLR